MPMFTTVRIGLPVKPSQTPDRTSSAKPAIFARTSCTSGTTSLPSTMITASAGARRAVCRTARPSVSLIFSPANIRPAAPGRSTASASATSRSRVSAVTRFLE